jgi:integrase
MSTEVRLTPESHPCQIHLRQDILFLQTPIQQKRNRYMSKRYQRGSVRLIGNVWKGRYWVDVPGEAKRKHPQVDLGTKPEMTKLAAKRKLEEIIGKLGLNTPTFLERLEVPAVTFSQVCDAWESKRLPQLALSTRTEAPGQLAMHLRPFFGIMPLEMIKTASVNDWIAGLVKLGLEPKTVHNKWKYFRGIMNWYARRMDEPKRQWHPDLPHIPDVERRWYTPAEMLQIIEISAQYPAWGQVKGQYRPLFRLDAFSGLRSGEVTAVHVEDLDFETKRIHVRRSIYKGVEVETKGKRRRKVFVDSITMQMLQEFLGDRRTGRVFQSRTGSPINNQQLNIVLRWATKKLEIKTGTMHAFRHGRISLLRGNGVMDKIVQEQVGHQDLKTTDGYTHMEAASISAMMEKLAVSCTQTPNVYTN